MLGPGGQSESAAVRLDIPALSGEIAWCPAVLKGFLWGYKRTLESHKELKQQLIPMWQWTENPRVGGSIPPLATTKTRTCAAFGGTSIPTAGILRELADT